MILVDRSHTIIKKGFIGIANFQLPALPLNPFLIQCIYPNEDPQLRTVQKRIMAKSGQRLLSLIDRGSQKNHFNW